MDLNTPGSTRMQNISVGMYRPHMDDIPQFPLHEGFRFRPFQDLSLIHI